MRHRLTNDEEILKMLSERKTQKEIAEYFKVSPAAICKRLKRLSPPPETPNFNGLTNKEKRFVIEKVKGKSNMQAVMASHDVTSKESAKSMASQLMSKPEIQLSITELMEHCGIDKPYRIRRLKNIIDSSDLNIAHKGLDMSFKLDGSYAPEKHVDYTLGYIIEQAHQSVGAGYAPEKHVDYTLSYREIVEEKERLIKEMERLERELGD